MHAWANLARNVAVIHVEKEYVQSMTADKNNYIIKHVRVAAAEYICAGLHCTRHGSLIPHGASCYESVRLDRVSSLDPLPLDRISISPSSLAVSPSPSPSSPHLISLVRPTPTPPHTHAQSVLTDLSVHFSWTCHHRPLALAALMPDIKKRSRLRGKPLLYAVSAFASLGVFLFGTSSSMGS